MSTQTETGIETRLFVAGAFVEAEGGRTFENRDPFTDELVSEVAAGSRGDAQRAVEAAAAAFAEWSQTPPAARQGIFLKAADVLEARQDEVVSMPVSVWVLIPGLLSRSALDPTAARRCVTTDAVFHSSRH